MTAFLDLHRPGDPLLLPNAWDRGSAALLESLGFSAIATTSSGFAATLGRIDGDTTRDEAIAHARELAQAVGIPVSADLENGYANTVEGVAETVRLAREAGLAGCSIEDWNGEHIYERAEAVARVEAALAAAGDDFVITARAENHLRGHDDLADTIDRLQAFAAAGAHVVYAPSLVAPADIRAVVDSVAPTPVNVLALPDAPPVGELATLGVARVSVGGAFAFAALGAAAEAARELREAGTYSFWSLAGTGAKAARSAFSR